MKQMIDYSKLSLSELGDRLGKARATLNAAKKEEAIVKEILKAKLKTDLPVVGKMFITEKVIGSRTAFDQGKTKDEMGQEWWDEHCTTNDSITIICKARKEE